MKGVAIAVKTDSAVYDALLEMVLRFTHIAGTAAAGSPVRFDDTSAADPRGSQALPGKTRQRQEGKS